MTINHIALWVQDLEGMKQFYETYFAAVPGKRYHNPKKNFTSYFLSLGTGPRLELMHNPEHSAVPGTGYAHIAISLGSREAVDKLTEKLRLEGVTVVGEPRTTGDGYYESVIEDPEGNLIELTV